MIDRSELLQNQYLLRRSRQLKEIEAEASEFSIPTLNENIAKQYIREQIEKNNRLNLRDNRDELLRCLKHQHNVSDRVLEYWLGKLLVPCSLEDASLEKYHACVYLLWPSEIAEDAFYSELKSYCSNEIHAKNQLSTLIKNAVEMHNLNPMRGVSVLDHDHFKVYIEPWEKRPSSRFRLNELMGELPASQFYYGDHHIPYEVLFELDKDSLVKSVSRLWSPYALRRALAHPDINEQRDALLFLLKKAPIAFQPNGEWNGSILLPTILHFVEHYLDETKNRWASTKNSEEIDGQNFPSFDDYFEPYLDVFSEAVFKREDCVNVAKFWLSSLLMKTSRGGWSGNKDEHFELENSRSYVKWKLALTLSEKLPIFEARSRAKEPKNIFEMWDCVAQIYPSIVRGEKPKFNPLVNVFSDYKEFCNNEKLRGLIRDFRGYQAKLDNVHFIALAWGFAAQGNIVENWSESWIDTAIYREAVKRKAALHYSDFSKECEAVVECLLLSGFLNIASTPLAALHSAKEREKLYIFVLDATKEMWLSTTEFTSNIWSKLFLNLLIQKMGIMDKPLLKYADAKEMAHLSALVVGINSLFVSLMRFMRNNNYPTGLLFQEWQNVGVNPKTTILAIIDGAEYNLDKFEIDDEEKAWLSDLVSS